MNNQQFSQQPLIAPCPRCNGRRIAGYGTDGRNPYQKWGLVFRTFGRGRITASMTLLVCTSCGYTEWYTNLEELARGAQMYPDEL
jgi:hypothetical protein